jgi:hypothetical protein
MGATAMIDLEQMVRSALARPVHEGYRFTIHGQAASKANSREIVLRKVKGTNKMRPASIKSDAALFFEEQALKQIPPKSRVRLEGPVRVTALILYDSERSDLDESVVLDVLQDRYQSVPIPGSDAKKRELVQHGVYRNDRQVKQKFIFHGIDTLMPRVEILIQSLQAQQGALL